MNDERMLTIRLTGVEFNCTAAMQDIHHVIHLLLTNATAWIEKQTLSEQR